MNSFIDFLSANSVWSVVLRGAIWLGAVLLLAYGADEGHKRQKIKGHVGFFFLFLTATGFLAYLIFGFVPTF